ncbi:MAG: Hsp20/alpha crystallin family protein [Caldilineaceae bacterium]
MSIRTYNGMVRDFVNLADAMNRSFNYDYARNGGSANGENGQVARKIVLPINAWANEDTYMVQAYLPGVAPDAVEITFEGDELTMRGEFPAVGEEVKFLKHELFSGAFERKLTFNVPVDVDKIEAVFENGALTLSIPKAEAAKPKQIKVVAK